MSALPLVREIGSIRDAVAMIDSHGDGIALVVDDQGRLVETVTDGDIRRAMLAGVALEAPLSVLLERLASGRPHGRTPVTAPVGATASELVALMQGTSVRQVPLVDLDGRPVELALLDDLVEPTGDTLRAMVMAGGFGRRLAPLTDELPKPMLPVGDRPLLQHIIEQLRDAGIGHVKVTTHYRGDAIAAYFGDGAELGVAIEYVSEEEPLGTAGALGLVDVDGPLLVMNGDLLTDVDIRAMHRFHDEQDAAMTVGVRAYDFDVPFGVVRLEGELITGIDEKPSIRGFVNAGLYLLNPDVRHVVSPGERLDMPELIDRLLTSGRRVVGFPVRERWLDVGRHDDYARARAGFSSASSTRRVGVRPVLAVVVARGGSKGLPNKAILPLRGMPLVVHSIELAHRCPDIARTVVSTDSEDIAAIARQAGADVPFIRPAALAQDDTPMWPVVRHALDAVDPDGTTYGSVLILQASNPVRLPKDVASAVELLDDRNEADSVAAVSAPNHHPLWTARVIQDGVLRPLVPSVAAYDRRQDAPAVFEVNGTLYLWRADVVRTHADDPGDAAIVLPLETPAERAINIDSAADLQLAEVLLREGILRLPWID